jgi:KaiB-like protein
MADEASAAAVRPVEVVLYLGPRSPTSVRAKRNLDAALQAYDPSTYQLIVRDVSEDLADAEADRVVFTPTLIVRHPEAPCTLVGDLGDTVLLTELLSLGGMEKTG